MISMQDSFVALHQTLLWYVLWKNWYWTPELYMQCAIFINLWSLGLCRWILMRTRSNLDELSNHCESVWLFAPPFLDSLSRSRLVSMQVQSHFSFQSPFVLFVVMPKQPPSAAAAAVCRHSFSVSPQRQASGLCQEVWCGIEGKQLTTATIVNINGGRSAGTIWVNFGAPVAH